MKKLTTALLASALLLSVLASCGNEAEKPGDTSETAKGTEPGTEEAEKHYSDSLAFTDYKGAEFRVYTSNTINGWAPVTIMNYTSKETGEVVNDALFKRDRFLEEKFNVSMKYEIEETGYSATQIDVLTKSILSGEEGTGYHMILLDHADVCNSLAGQGMLYPLNHVDGINLDADYWMKELNDKCRIGESLYYASCAISPRYYSSVYVVMFNRDMANDLDLEDMYKLVEDGKWTYDKMFSIAKKAAGDLNGDSKLDTTDRLGCMYGCQEGYLLGAGLSMVENRGGTLVCTLDDSKVIDYLHKLTDCFQYEGIYYEGNAELDYDSVINNGTALFSNPMAANLSDYRDLPYDYGILPLPKLNEEQKGYVGFSQPWVNATPMVPITVADSELSMVGTLTDAMAAYGYDYVRPAVFDNVIRAKGTRDEQSARIIDLIFENVQLELASDLGLRELTNIFYDYTARKLGEQDIVSVYAEQKSAIDAAIRKIMDTYAANEENIFG